MKKTSAGRPINPVDKAFGARVKAFRRDRGMTQTDLAGVLGKTASWVSQVERGVQPVERLDVLQELADGLGVSVQQLRPGELLPDSTSAAQQTMLKANDLDEARRLISGHPAVDALLGLAPPAGSRTAEQLTTAVDELWELTHAGRLAEVSDLVTELVPDLEYFVRTVSEDERSTAYLLLARMYQALAAAFVRQGEADAAWVAADRAIWAAERHGDPLHVCAGVFRMIQAFIRLKHLNQAEHAATSAITALERVDLEPAGLSVLGSLHLALALVHARGGDRTEAKQQIQAARGIAQRIGEDRNDLNLEFGPTNVEIQAVSTAVDLGDAGEALDIGLAIDADALSPERQGRLLMDLGRAQAQRRHPGEALKFLLAAEKVAPETIRTHLVARAAIKELVLIAGTTASRDLLALAERADALE